ncbi:23S rRNA (uracil(1939)-C(5))-methyltransferase RlmD [[Clostridium] symbiosum]|uniref:23S rRNA (uracil(1939)-C(5))-methyltransferase RlmD n=1 Tax=Clostridium symbiosum TaxID=1512 RepID=UPI002108F721|nr:23S rRNA (uracil(1939)-C(5))-methyltransferase RlmD [[Clostridium] symbiosum]MCQ4835752.1 23S rRNA (uracil(1939)-C(5))-methyltransferase RlmD [[Clostridium] symbiosum]
MKKGEIYEGIVEKIEFPNKGILHIEDEKVIVKNALPGQKIQFLVNKKRKGKCEGRLMQVLERSEIETAETVCPHFGICGGCLYQTIPYETQLEIKKEQVKELLDGVCGEYEFEGIKGSPLADCYRNKMEFSFGDEVKDGPLALGMHKRGSFYDVVTTGECRIVHKDFCDILLCTKAYFEEKEVGFYKKMQHTGYLRHLLVRRAVKTGEILLDLITTTQIGVEEEKKLLAGWLERLLALPLEGKMAGILHTKNDSLADAVKDEGTEVLYGKDYFFEELLGLKFRISPFSFFQTNSLGAEVLYEKTREYVGETKGKVVFDLYSGTGTIAQILAPVAEKVVGVEIVKEAVEAAKENARLNGLDNCEFIAGDVLKVVDELTDKPELIVLDPPRDGIHPKAIEKIIGFGVERMVYVSCKPTSLARDLVILQENGYRVEKGCCVDMFPGTANVETVVSLTLKNEGLKPTYHIELEIPMETEGENDEIKYRSKERQATYPKIKEYIKDKFGVNVHTQDIAEVKSLCGLEKRPNYNKSKKAEPKIRHCVPEKAEYIKSALNYYGLI